MSSSFRADWSLLATADGVRTIVVWDTDSWDVSATHEIGRDRARVVFDPATGDLLVMSVDPPGLVRADPSSGEQLQFLKLRAPSENPPVTTSG